jgi:hypothetical protein
MMLNLDGRFFGDKILGPKSIVFLMVRSLCLGCQNLRQLIKSLKTMSFLMITPFGSIKTVDATLG